MKTLLTLLLLSSITFASKPQATPPEDHAEAELTRIHTVLEKYKVLVGVYPSTKQGLSALVSPPTSSPIPKRWMSQLTEVPRDPWKREYQYSNTNGSIKLWSSGPSLKDPSDDIHLVKN